jgi:hypothetical protein
MPPHYRNRLLGQLPTHLGPEGRRRSIEKMVYDAKAFERQSEQGFNPREMGVPALARLEIPVREIADYRAIADELRKLANEYDLLARQRDRPDWAVQMEAVLHVRTVTKKLKQRVQTNRCPTSSGGSG